MAINPDDFRDDQIERKNAVVPIEYDYRAAVRKIKGMLVDGDCYAYAEDFLTDVLEQIERKQAISEKQWNAIERIYDHPSRYGDDDRRKSRRWEGGSGWPR